MAEDHIYLTVDKNPKGKGLLAVMTQGHIQYGDAECIVLTLEVVPNMKAAKKWFKQMKIERPWETRQ
jgi:hypothetical protein